MDGVTLHVDHVIPQSDGGSDAALNLVAACKECNEGKHAKRLPRHLEQDVLEMLKAKK